MQILALALLSVAVIAMAGAIFERAASSRDQKRYPPPGRLVDIGGRRLHLVHTRAGSGPTVVIISGRFNVSLLWSRVQEAIASFASVCTHDRAGYAWSDPDPVPRTGDRVAADLHVLLHRAEVPYTEGEALGQPRRMKQMQERSMRLLRCASLVGVARLAAPLTHSMLDQLGGFPLTAKREMIALSVNARLWRAVDAEWQQVEAMARQVGGPGSLGDIPLVVLRSERCDMKAGDGSTEAQVKDLWRLMKESQAALVQLSSRGRLVSLPDTGHEVNLERPEAVAAAVREMLLSLATDAL